MTGLTQLVAKFLSSNALVFATAFNFGDHAKEVGQEKGKPFVFLKGTGRDFPDPFSSKLSPYSPKAILFEVEALGGKRLAKRFEYNSEFGKLMDYEVELGIVILEEITKEKLESKNEINAVFVLANDWTQRELQVLGEGAKTPLKWWQKAKGLKNYLSLGSKAYSSKGKIKLDEWPNLELTLKVDSIVRQQAIAKEMIFTPKELIAEALRVNKSNLPRGTILLAGTPSGIAFKSSEWKRKLADILKFPPWLRLKLALKMFSDSEQFLQSKQVVEHSMKDLGTNKIIDSFTVRIQ